jgi:hypothetical protein
VTVALATASPAGAASPIVIGPGRDASVAVDAGGTAHVAYNDNATADQRVHYCRLPRGSTTCGSAQTLTLPGSTVSRPYVFTEGGTVRILAYRYGFPSGSFGQDVLLTSTDGGDHFGQPVSVGTLQADDAVAGPGAGISIVSAAQSNSPAYQLVPTDGSAAAVGYAKLSESAPYHTSVGLLEGKTPVVASDDGTAKRALYSVYRGGDLHDPGSWRGGLLNDGAVSQVAGGPAGVFVLNDVTARDGGHELRVYVLGDNNEFSRGSGGVSAAPGFAAATLIEDPGGVLHAVYAPGTRLFDVAAPGTTEFGRETELVTDTEFSGLRAAAGIDHAGVAVWHTGPGEVHATRLVSTASSPATSTYDLRAKGLEVTQGVQTQEPAFMGGELPSLFPAPTAETPLPERRFGNVKYKGVQLAAYSKTVVRFFADATGARASGVIGVLHAYHGDRELPGSPLLAENGSRELADGGCACVTAKERANAAASYDFTLPLEWTVSGNVHLTLRGELRQPTQILLPFSKVKPRAARARECAKCEGNNRFTLTDIGFLPTPTVVIAPVRMLTGGQADLPDPAKVFAPALNLHPGGERFSIEPYQANLDVSAEAGWTEASPECKKYVEDKHFGDCKNDAYLNRVWRWDHAQGGLSDMAIGVNTHERGAASRSLFNLPFGNPDLTATAEEVSARPVAVVNTSRPLSSIGHELGHLFGRIHASAACDGNGNDWPPDQVGYVDGVGLDRSQRTNDPGAPYRVVTGKPPSKGNCSGASPPGCGGAEPEHYFDLMSYCGTEGTDWIAARNWQVEIGTLNRFGQRVGFDARSFPSTSVPYVSATASRAATVKRLHVGALVSAGGAVVTDVAPSAHPAPEAKQSPYSLVVADGAGAPLSSTRMSATGGHVEGGGAFTELSADVPASAAAGSVSVVQDGAAIATRPRSAHPPTVRVIAPAGGARVARQATVRWVATDADDDALTATVAYSRDDGRTWRTIYSGPDQGKALLPGAYFSGSRRARVLVRVSDGFDETGARSARFRAKGAPPLVRIHSAGTAARLLNTSTLVLSGEGFDDASQPITGRRLTWFADRRRIGRGPRLATADLSPGRQRIRLVARDRTGRRGSATVPVRVIATRPQLLSLSGPKRVGRRARSLRLQIAVSVRARLTVNGRSFPVGRKARSVRIPIRAGRGAVRLRLRLSAGGRRAVLPLIISRS